MILNFLIVYIWSQSIWSGGDSQFYYIDTTKFYYSYNIDPFKPKGTLSLKYISFIPIFELDTSSISRVSRIKEIEGKFYFLKSYPVGIVYYSDDFINLYRLPDYPYPQNFLPETINDILKKGNFFIICGKKLNYDNGYIYKFDRSSNSWIWPPLQPGGVHNIFKFFDNFPQTFISAISGSQYQWIKSNDLFSTYPDVVQILNSRYIEKAEIVPDYSASDTFIVAIFNYQGQRNIYYSDYNPPEGNWYKYYNTYRAFQAGEIVYDSLSNYVYIPVSKAESSLIRVFNPQTKQIDTSIYLDNSVLFNGLTKGKDNNLYAATLKYVYRSIDGKKWDVIGYIGNAYSIYQTSDYELLVGTIGPARIYKANYPSQGYLESSIFTSRNKKEGATFFGRVFVEGDHIDYIKIQIRGDTLDSLQSAPSWGLLPFLSNGDTITYLSPKLRYFQYRILIYKTPEGKTPRINRIYFTYDLDTTGPLISECFISDGNASGNGMDYDDRLVIVFNEKTNRPFVNISGIDTLFYVSGGHTLAGSDSARWKNDDTLEIFVFGSPSPPQSGDTLKILKKFIKDIWGNSTLSSVIITGSYDDLNPPKLKKVILSDGNTPDDGAGSGDSVKMIFSEKTNTPFVPPESLDTWFPLNSASWLNPGYTLQTIWKSEDTLLILFNGFGKEPILRGDSVGISPSNPIKDLAGNNIMPGKVKSEGSLDEKNPEISSLIFYDFKPFGSNPNSNLDHTIIKFSEPIILLDSINKSNIDSVFKLSYNHSWLSGNGNITRISLLSDTIFLIQFSTDGGNPTVTEGDTIYPDSLFFMDRNKNKIKGFQILTRLLKIEEENSGKEGVSIKIKNNLFTIITPFAIEIEIFDISGRKFFYKKYQKGIKREILPFKSGVYFMKVKKRNKKIFDNKIFIIKNK